MRKNTGKKINVTLISWAEFKLGRASLSYAHFYRGYEEIPNSAADHLGHRHSHGHHADNKDGEGEVASIPLHEGYHYTDDHQRVAEEHLPKVWAKHARKETVDLRLKWAV